jgi:DNA-directed RNA polymerase subunit RPC12/RpoP
LKEAAVPLFRNFYRCAECSREWTDEWSAQCDDDCPNCGARHISPYKSEDVQREDVRTKTNGIARARLNRIKVLNDNFRRTFTGGQVYLTTGVAALEARKKAQVLEAVRKFSLFDEGNDPHGEHDFASIEVDGENYFFKIDYYDTDIRYLSDDPSDPSCTKRIMTIMLASEY